MAYGFQQVDPKTFYDKAQTARDTALNLYTSQQRPDVSGKKTAGGAIGAVAGGAAAGAGVSAALGLAGGAALASTGIGAAALGLAYFLS